MATPSKNSLPDKPKLGRPRRELDVKLLKKMAAVNCSLAEMADYLGVEKHLLSKPYWSEIIKKEKARLNMRIRSWQVKSAQAGNGVMLTHLGKHILGQTDEANGQQNSSITVNFIKVSNGEKTNSLDDAGSDSTRRQIPEFVSDQE